LVALSGGNVGNSGGMVRAIVHPINDGGHKHDCGNNSQIHFVDLSDWTGEFSPGSISLICASYISD
jgi:hypothetical protein